MKPKTKSKNKTDKYFLLSWRKLWIIIMTGFVSIILHNAIYALFNFEEAAFFIIVVILVTLYLILSVLYTLFRIIKKKK